MAAGLREEVVRRRNLGKEGGRGFSYEDEDPVPKAWELETLKPITTRNFVHYSPI